MKIAFKEWAVVTDALGRGEQVIILRKGGIREGRGGFRPEHSRFLLFPTLFHQQRESVVPAAQVRFDEIAPGFPPPGVVRIEFVVDVVEARRLESPAQVSALRGLHVWREDVIAARFEWGAERALHALVLRASRLASPVELPVRESYGGCKSWVELATDIVTEGARPVLADAEFSGRLASFRSALASAASEVSR